MKISRKGLELIETFEECYLTACQDRSGIWRIGYGWIHPVNRQKVTAGMTISREKAEELLLRGLTRYENGVTGRLKIVINQNQFDALVDFTYDMGLKALAGSTLLKKLNAGDYPGAADELLKWSCKGGKILPELARRREAERVLFLTS